MELAIDVLIDVDGWSTNGGINMKAITAKRVLISVVGISSMSMMAGCANYEVNTKRGNIPGHYIRYEMQEADRAVESARLAGKDKTCPVEYKEAEDAKNKAYDVFRACHTEEGAALAKQATAKANALCPPRPVAAVKPEPKLVEPVVILVSEPKVEEKVIAVIAEPKIAERVIVLALEDIHFEFDKSTLTDEAKVILKRNFKILNENPKAKVRVAGYTSASGTEEYNQKLSERRADAVKSYLIEEGVATPDRLTEIGYGEEKPAIIEAAPKDLYSNAAKANMRVLFEVIVK